MPVGLTTMDRILLAIIASAVLLLLGAASLYVTNTADLMNTPARSGSPVELDKCEPLADVGERSQPFHVGLAAQSTRLRPPGAASVSSSDSRGLSRRALAGTISILLRSLAEVHFSPWHRSEGSQSLPQVLAGVPYGVLGDHSGERSKVNRPIDLATLHDSVS